MPLHFIFFSLQGTFTHRKCTRACPWLLSQACSAPATTSTWWCHTHCHRANTTGGSHQ